jgi:DNA-binding PucR family transcriptional regulator
MVRCSWALAAAEELHVHPNTVRQHLDRVEELTEIRLAEDDLLALEVALKLFRLSAGR